MLKAFVAGVLLAAVIGIGNALYKRFILKNLSEFELNNFYIEIPHLFMSHVYFGLYMVLAIYMLIFLFLKQKEKSRFQKLLTSVLVSFLYVLVFTSGSFMSFIVLVLSTGLLVCYFLYEHFKLTYIVIALLVVVGAAGLLINSGHPSLNRYKQRIFLSFDNVENDQYNYSSNRVGPLVAGFSVAKDNWLWGVGTSDTEKAMEASYIEHGLDQLIHLNTHNQYLDFLITFGIFGLALYLLTLLYPLYISIKYKYYLYTFFLILILISGITENILASNKGILLYALFNSIFASQFLYGKTSNAENT
ncbi:O-antigen ligase family protein [Pontibacter ramchanderi]|uniref:O-antigen ligase family protein n=1 Tax=Pontibacter ramchanderi TaxID=1179743 RepID=UPI0015D5D550|nr:O-antigen ligase family protein [Pontibacter ramchanderi]